MRWEIDARYSLSVQMCERKKETELHWSKRIDKFQELAGSVNAFETAEYGCMGVYVEYCLRICLVPNRYCSKLFYQFSSLI